VWCALDMAMRAGGRGDRRSGDERVARDTFTMLPFAEVRGPEETGPAGGGDPVSSEAR